MDASAINAPFLLSKLAHGNRVDGTSKHSTSVPPAAPTTSAAATEAERNPVTPEGDFSSPRQSGDGILPAPALAENEPEKTYEEGPPAFDAVFSNAALHWVRAPRTVIEGAKRVLRPGGRY